MQTEAQPLRPDMYLQKLFEHNHWANQRLIETCAQLTDDQLDAGPKSAGYGSIRQTLIHLVTAQVGYVKLLTQPVEERRRNSVNLTLADLDEAAQTSGIRLLELVRDGGLNLPSEQLETTDGYRVEPWVVLLQALDHAAEHRQQICAQLSALEITPPALDGWSFGEAQGGLVVK